MSGLKDDRGRGAGIALAVVLVAVGIAGAVYELRSPPPPAPAASAPAPAAPAASAPAAATPAAPAEEVDNCRFPGMVPTIPRGETATPEDMKTQHDAIQGFVHALEDYQKCEMDKITPTTDEATKDRLTKLGNRAVDAAHALANAFAVELKAYHEKHPEPLPEK
jgi:hypothetical protein